MLVSTSRAKKNFFDSRSGFLSGWLYTRNKYEAAFNNPVAKKSLIQNKGGGKVTYKQYIEENIWIVATK